MIVTIFGQMHNGKSTFAKMLQSYLTDFHIASFAKDVKRCVSRKFSVSLEFIEDWKNNPNPPPGFTCPMRDILQHEGQTARDIKPDVWISKVIPNPLNIIIDDGRYFDEMEYTHGHGSYNILIVRPDNVNNSEHRSEKEVGEVVNAVINRRPHYANRWLHSVVLNNCTLADLEVTAQTISNDIKQQEGIKRAK